MASVKVKIRRKGGPGSGNWNHKGRPGMVGGSVSGGSAYTVRHAGMSIIIPNSLSKTMQKLYGNEQFITPTVKDGKPRECQENARVEYWNQKKAGNNPTYVVGEAINLTDEAVASVAHRFYGNEGDLAAIKMYLSPNNVVHAWVEVDGKIIDPTPIMIGGDPNKLRPASSARYAKYVKKLEVSTYTDFVLTEPLKLPSEVRRRLDLM